MLAIVCGKCVVVIQTTYLRVFVVRPERCKNGGQSTKIIQFHRNKRIRMRCFPKEAQHRYVSPGGAAFLSAQTFNCFEQIFLPVLLKHKTTPTRT